MKSVVVTVRLTGDEHARLENFATKQRGRASNGSVLRQALLEFLDRYEVNQVVEDDASVSEAVSVAL